MEVTDITKEDFEAYVEVQKSGMTNMFMVSTVCDLSGLEKNQVLTIMEHYSEYEEMFEKEDN